MRIISRPQGQAEAMLILVTLFWGLSFPLMKQALVELPVLSFLWQRFALALLLLLPFCLPAIKKLNPRGWFNGVILGLLLFLSFLFQTIGLDQTSASNAGFITGLCVIWVPLLAIVLIHRPPAKGALIGVMLALPGLFLLTWHSPWQPTIGDGWVLLSSLFIALHIIGLDSLARGHDGGALTLLQIGLVTLLTLAASLWFDPPVIFSSYSSQLINTLVITAVFATALAFWVQTSFQRDTSPTRAALIYIMEPLFAALFSIWLLNEQLSSMAWLGGGLIISGMLTAELWGPRRTAEKSGTSPAIETIR